MTGRTLKGLRNMQNFSDYEKYIAGGCNTLSKHPDRFPRGKYPTLTQSGKGCRFKDTKGKEYIDYEMALGPIILGYRYDKVDNAVCKAVKDYGNIFSLGHPMEAELASLIHDIIPWVDKMRFLTNGRDACDAAVKIARGYTGRDKILSFSYHGFSDWMMCQDDKYMGIPKAYNKDIITFDYNDLEVIKGHIQNAACVIMEPHTIEMPKPGYLETIRALCTHHNVPLIFDEVVSFPRYKSKSFTAGEYFGVEPDIICLSKALANGYPIAAVAGKEKFMRQIQNVFISTTFGGNLVGVSAAIATLKEIIEKDVNEHIYKVGRQFRRQMEQSGVPLKGIPSRQFFNFNNKEIDAKFKERMSMGGAHFHIPIFFSYSHKPIDIIRTAWEAKKAMEGIEDYKLVGKMPVEAIPRT